ncbi:hypothetical protein A9K97_gp226 [Tokyovirus A1]|uniref:hypothetical protein n=1 Tax=Tokyovirus A1 TaxID=1826170 RepID=UPI0007A98147|nr:hypothetical protein A9K97_gp226 [Tokyovirus A1]BAU80125.1 hypothetical protein [Tokyovirus A1]
MEETDQVIIRLLSENDQKVETIRELERDLSEMRGLHQKTLDEVSQLKEKNFELVARVLEMEQKILESMDNFSILE